MQDPTAKTEYNNIYLMIWDPIFSTKISSLDKWTELEYTSCSVKIVTMQRRAYIMSSLFWIQKEKQLMMSPLISLEIKAFSDSEQSFSRFLRT